MGKFLLLFLAWSIVAGFLGFFLGLITASFLTRGPRILREQTDISGEIPVYEQFRLDKPE